MTTELLILASIILIVVLALAYTAGFAKGYVECERDVSEGKENPYFSADESVIKQ